MINVVPLCSTPPATSSASICVKGMGKAHTDLCMLLLHVFSLMQHPSGGHIALYIATTAVFIALLMNQHIIATTMSVSSSLLVDKT